MPLHCSALRRPIPVHQRSALIVSGAGKVLHEESMSRHSRDRGRDRGRSRRRRRTEKPSMTGLLLSWLPALLAIVVAMVMILPILARWRRMARDAVVLQPLTKNSESLGKFPRNKTFPVTASDTLIQHVQRQIAPPAPFLSHHHGTNGMRRRIKRWRRERHDMWRERQRRVALQVALSPLPSRAGRRNVVRDHVGRIVEPASPRDAADEGRSHDKRSHAQMNVAVKEAPTPVSKLLEKGAEPSVEKKDNSVVDELKDSESRSSNENTKNGSSKAVEFYGCRGGTLDGMIRGHNITRISFTVYKIMRLFGFSSVTDSPAGAHAEWMGEFTQRMAFEQPMFRYVGVDKDAVALARARSSIDGSIDGDFEVRDVERSFGISTDVLFHWTELDHSRTDPRNEGYLLHLQKVIRAAKAVDHGYLIIGQFPRLNGPMPTYRNGKWIFLDGAKEDPFFFNDYVRGAVPVTENSQAYAFYLTVYSLRAIPVKELDV